MARGQAGLLRRVQILAGVVVLVVLTVLGVAMSSAVSARRATQLRADQLGPATTTAYALLADFIDEETGVRGYLLTRQRSFLGPFLQAEPRIDARFGSLTNQLRGQPTLLDQLAEVRVAHQAWLASVVQPEIRAVDGGNSGAALTLERSGAGKRQFDGLRGQVTELQAGIQDTLNAQSSRISHAQRLLSIALLAAVALVLGLVAALALAVSRLILQPFERLRRAVDAVGAGQLDTTVPITGPPEVAELGASVERMRARLVASLEESRRAVEALSQQGPAVIALRDALAPTRRVPTGVVVVGRLDPAEGFLAGDWYDAIRLSENRLAVVVGDVAGHGAGPGVFALRLKHLLTAALATDMAPGAALEWVVGQLGDTGELFATAIVLVVDPATGRVDYANAGHPEAVVIPVGGATADDGAARAPRPLPPSGPMLTELLAEPGAWETRHFTLATDETLLAYTDGLIEARTPGGEQVGLPGLLGQLQHQHPRDGQLTPQALLDEVFTIVGRAAPGPAADDRTALAIARTPVAGAPPRQAGESVLDRTGA